MIAVLASVPVAKKKKPPPVNWKKKKPPYTVGKDGFNYCNVVFKEKWADACLYRPHPYDLVTVKTTDKFCSAWWNGTTWDGLRLNENEKVLAWKNVRHETFSQIG